MAGFEAFRIYGRIEADTSGLESSLSRAKGQVDGLATSLQNTGQRLSSIGSNLTTKVTLPIVGAMTASFKAASDLNESLSKVSVVFGDLSDEMVKWSETSAEAMGMSQQQALEAAGTFGNFMKAMGLAGDEAANMSRDLVELAADLASFNNADPSEVLLALRAGLAGEAEPLRRFGVQISAARVEAEGLAIGLNKSYQEMTAAERAMATFNIIMRDTALAQGDFERTSEGAANKMRILKAELVDSAAQIGQEFIPIGIELMDILGGWLESFKGMDKDTQRFLIKMLAIAAVAGPFAKIAGSLLSMAGSILKIAGAGRAVGIMQGVAGAGSVGGAGAAAGGAAGVGIAAVVAAIVGSVAAFKDLNDQIDEGVDQLGNFNGKLEDATVETDGFFQDFFGAFNPFFKLADKLGIDDAAIEAEARQRYLEQMQQMVEALGYVNPQLKTLADNLTKTYSMTEEEGGKLAGLIRSLEMFGGAIDKNREQQLRNVLEMGDTRRAFQLLKAWIDEVRGSLRVLNSVLLTVTSTAGSQLPGGGQYRLPPEFVGGDGVPGRRRRRRRRNNTAAGGLVTGPQIRMVGEAGPEAIIPLNKLEVMLKRDNANIKSVAGSDSSREMRHFGRLLKESTDATERNIQALQDAEYQVEFFGAALANASAEMENTGGGLKAWFASLTEREARIYRKQMNDEFRELLRTYRNIGGMQNGGASPWNSPAAISQLNMDRIMSQQGGTAAAISRLERTMAASSGQPIVVRIDRKAFQRDVDYIERARNL